MKLTIVRSVGDQDSTAPIGVSDQSIERMSAAILLSPERQSIAEDALAAPG